jgi:hypothetical protein
MPSDPNDPNKPQGRPEQDPAGDERRPASEGEGEDKHEHDKQRDGMNPLGL